jgi:hypothetical protein
MSPQTDCLETNPVVDRSTNAIAQQIPMTGVIVYVVLVMAWVFLVPGYVAIRDHAFTDSQVASHLKGTALTEWNGYQARLKAADVTTAEKISPPFRVSGMATDWLMQIWAISYLGVGTLIFYWQKWPRYSIRPSMVFLTGIGLDLIFNWTNYVRNFVLQTPEAGRKLYSFVHWDISPLGFLMQECRTLGFMVLIAVFINLTNSVAKKLNDSAQVGQNSPISLSDLVGEAVINLEILRRWQFSSLILAIVFVPWSYFYWDHIVSMHDTRYLPSAVGIHLIWFLCWYQATGPLLLSVHNWRSMKLKALSATDADREAIKDVAKVARTDSEWQLVSAAVAALGSLLLPLLKALR